MATYQEILTKAVVGKGSLDLDENIKLEVKASKVLGCWVINLKISPVMKEEKIYIEGSYFLHIWCGLDDNKDSEIIKKEIIFSKEVELKMNNKADSLNEKKLKLYVKTYPYCHKLELANGVINVGVKSEFLLDAIGEAIIKVQISDSKDDNLNVEEEIERNVNVDYLNSSKNK